jgi:hypothetical protein
MSEFSDSSSDKRKGASKPTRQCTSKRRIGSVVVGSVVVAPTQDDDSIDDFIIPYPHAKKPTSCKASTKSGGWEKRGYVKMTVSKSLRCEEG